MTADSWQEKWQNVFIEMNFVVGVWSPEIICCCGACGHEDDFVAVLMPIAWTESQLDEKKTLRRKAVLGLNDCKDDNDDDKMEMSHQGEEIETRKDVSVVVYDAVLWQPTVLSCRVGT